MKLSGVLKIGFLALTVGFVQLAHGQATADAAGQAKQIDNTVENSHLCSTAQGEMLKSMVIYGTPGDPTVLQPVSNKVNPETDANNCLTSINDIVNSTKNADPTLMDSIKQRIVSALVWVTSVVQMNSNPSINVPVNTPIATIGIRG
jgi:hypothetical protein